MDYVLIILGILAILAGFIGAILPVLPGPPLSYLGLLLLHFTSRYQFSTKFLILWGLVTAGAFLLDYVIPALGTKKFGGTKRGIWGSVIGLLAGMVFFPPFGIVIGPFVGAVLGELSGGKQTREALRSGLGSFFGLLIGTILKLMVSGLMAWEFFVKLF